MKNICHKQNKNSKYALSIPNFNASNKRQRGVESVRDCACMQTHRGTKGKKNVGRNFRVSFTMFIIKD